MIRFICSGILSTLLSFIIPVMSSANDTVARVATGGITFLKSENIAMLQETLKISTDKIEVHYRFMNESDKDIKTTVAFPMPPFGWNPGASAYDSNNVPLKGFKTVVDGNAVKTKIIRRAVINGQDITNKLRKIGLSDKQIFETFGYDDPKLTEQYAYTKYQISQLQKLAVVDGGSPLWKVQETAVWEQKFPAGKEIVIEHEYKPFDGGYYSVPYQREYKYLDLGSIPTGKSLKNEACFDDYARRDIERQIKTAANKKVKEVYVFLTDIEYVLGTGRNWKGPIKDFRLIIKKKSPDDFVSLCFPGKPKKVDATTIEFLQKDYVPQDKLVVYFYSVQGK